MRACAYVPYILRVCAYMRACANYNRCFLNIEDNVDFYIDFIANFKHIEISDTKPCWAAADKLITMWILMMENLMENHRDLWNVNCEKMLKSLIYLYISYKCINIALVI